jgi:hypothetical protein
MLLATVPPILENWVGTGVKGDMWVTVFARACLLRVIKEASWPFWNPIVVVRWL